MEFKTGIPIYTQVINSLKEQIITGILKPGDKLPSSRELAQQYQINPNTASRVYSEMDSQKLSFTKRGIGTFVTEDENIVSNMKKEYVERLIDEFADKMERIGYEKGQLTQLLQVYIEGDLNNSGKRVENKEF